MTTIELNKLKQIKLSELGWRFELHYIEQFDLITIDTNSGYQLIFFKGKLIHTNILMEKSLVNNWLNEIADNALKSRRTHGKCAEPAAISKWLWEIDPKGKMKIEQARKELEGVVSKAVKIKGKKVRSIEHGKHKKACDSCNPLLEYFNITEVH